MRIPSRRLTPLPGRAARPRCVAHALTARPRAGGIAAEYAEEEAEAAEIEAAENSAALDVPLNLRITKGLDAQLRRRAAAEQIPTSALVRRLLTRSVRDGAASALTEDQVEQVEGIARRVAHEPAAPG